MDTQTVQLLIAGAVGAIIGRTQTTIRSLIYLGILVGVVYILYIHG